MVASVAQEKTFDEYLEEYFAIQPDDERLYEFECGKWILKPSASNRNQHITMFLAFYLFKVGVTDRYLRMYMTEIVVMGGQVAIRVPDLLVLSEGSVTALRNLPRATLLLHMPAPELVIEVVSPDKRSMTRNYRQKRLEYQSRGIAEYWIIDPLTEKITIFSWNNWLYDETVFTGSDVLNSPWLEQHPSEEKLTVNQILQRK